MKLLLTKAKSLVTTVRSWGVSVMKKIQDWWW